MATGRGRVVHDCHAEVLCRRAFQRYLLSEMEGPRGEDDAGGERVLARAPGEGRSWELRSGLRLHFYVSALPCGEAALVPISAPPRARWRGSGCGSRAAPPAQRRRRPRRAPRRWSTATARAPSQRAACHRTHARRAGTSTSGASCGTSLGAATPSRSRAPSATACSDKICRWNHVGWQGALLSRLLPKPVAMASIVVGGPLFDEPFVREALYCRAGAAATGLGCPDFRHTLVPFHWSREAMEASGAGLKPNGTKVSTVGLSVAWSPAVGGGGAHERSISRSVGGFFDVLMGHTGERQGLRCDRQGKKASLGGGTSGKGPQAGAPQQLDSWVSPLCKCLMAKDLLRALPRLNGAQLPAAGGPERGGPAADAPEPAAAGPPAPSAPCAAGAATAAAEAAPSAAGAAPDAAAASGAAAASARAEAQPPPAKRARAGVADGAPDGALGGAAAPRTYGWLKEALADPAYRERRRRFHSCDVFVHWRGKQDVDAFPLDLCDLDAAASSQP
ncbi:unnamed protein product [Prorocentrum cordatum]|uniref:A to I editase domain-containing protein n=1 Tax=Prorocentrum cordatum TaxID=2364126 RepID=A0ABN9PHB5_9DINO|nr:unnamed protein product [Polarella glacialis]